MERDKKKLDWIDFWNGQHHIYVNSVHKVAHDRLITRGIASYISVGSQVLDYGCGQNTSVEELSMKPARLTLCDAAKTVRSLLHSRFPSHDRIKIISPEELKLQPDGSFDLIVMHSVAQYLTKTEMTSLMIEFHRLLKCGGTLILGDIISETQSAVADVEALLKFARDERFFFAAIWGLVRTSISPYRKLRANLGLATYNPEAVSSLMETAKFACRRAERNIGHHQKRSTYVCEKRE